MTIPLAPVVPNPNSATFSDDAYAFTQWMATVGPAIDIETARIDTIGFGSYTSTSTTSLIIGTGSKSLVIAAGKSFGIGQPIVCASSVTPSNFMFGQVTSYNPATGALVINVLSISGSGTLAAWSVSVGASAIGGGVSPDSIVTLTSGTSWTCPAGVTKVRLSMVGGGGGAGMGITTTASVCGAGGGYCEKLVVVVPATAYPYSIGAAGSAAGADNTSGTSGGATAMFGATASGGAGGATSGTASAGGSATGGDINVAGGNGNYGGGASITAAQGGDSKFGRGGRAMSVSGNGYGSGGYSGGSNYGGSGSGTAGVIVLELYK